MIRAYYLITDSLKAQNGDMYDVPKHLKLQASERLIRVSAKVTDGRLSGQQP